LARPAEFLVFDLVVEERAVEEVRGGAVDRRLRSADPDLVERGVDAREELALLYEHAFTDGDLYHRPGHLRV
jgi:hypothetical protein